MFLQNKFSEDAIYLRKAAEQHQRFKFILQIKFPYIIE